MKYENIHDFRRKNEVFNEIIDEVLTIGNEISDQQVDRMTKAIQGANHIF